MHNQWKMSVAIKCSPLFLLLLGGASCANRHGASGSQDADQPGVDALLNSIDIVEISQNGMRKRIPTQRSGLANTAILGVDSTIELRPHVPLANEVIEHNDPMRSFIIKPYLVHAGTAGKLTHQEILLDDSNEWVRRLKVVKSSDDLKDLESKLSTQTKIPITSDEITSEVAFELEKNDNTIDSVNLISLVDKKMVNGGAIAGIFSKKLFLAVDRYEYRNGKELFIYNPNAPSAAQPAQGQQPNASNQNPSQPDANGQSSPKPVDDAEKPPQTSLSVLPIAKSTVTGNSPPGSVGLSYLNDGDLVYYVIYNNKIIDKQHWGALDNWAHGSAPSLNLSDLNLKGSQDRSSAQPGDQIEWRIFELNRTAQFETPVTFTADAVKLISTDDAAQIITKDSRANESTSSLVSYYRMSPEQKTVTDIPLQETGFGIQTIPSFSLVSQINTHNHFKHSQVSRNALIPGENSFSLGSSFFLYHHTRGTYSSSWYNLTERWADYLPGINISYIALTNTGNSKSRLSAGLVWNPYVDGRKFVSLTYGFQAFKYPYVGLAFGFAADFTKILTSGTN